MSSVPDYTPTPLEDAYTSYLLQAVFDLDPRVPEIKISGREAVTFLSKSAVHRLILRNLWSTVDPQSAGALLHRHQLSTLLRCVALAQYPKQDSFLNQALQAAYHEQKSPVEAIRGCLQATAQQTDIPLASFDGIPVPDQTTLKPYMKEDDTEEDETETDDFGDFSTAAAPATNMATPNATTPSNWGAFNGLTSSGGSSGAGMVEGIPQQRTVGSNMGTVPFPQQPTNMGMNPPQQQQQPFVGMMQQNQQQPGMGMAPQQSTASQASDWGAFDGLAAAPAQSTMQNQTNSDFGGFTSSSTSMPPTQMSSTTVSSSGWGAMDALASTASAMPAMNDGFGAFGSAASAQAASTGMMPTNPLQSTSSFDSGMGGFGSFNSSAQQAQPSSEPSGWDALDALASSTPEAPPPVLPSAQPEPPPQPDAGGEDDDFGDFESSAEQQPPVKAQESLNPGSSGALEATVSKVPETSTTDENGIPKPPTNDFGGFGSFQQPTPEQSAASQGPSGWDALDALASSDPAPPPILPDPSATESPAMLEKQTEVQTAEEDDFGDFASTTGKNQEQSSGWDALDALAPTQDPPPALHDASAAVSDEPVQTSTDSNPSPVYSAPTVGNDDDFGGFESSGQNAPVANGGLTIGAHMDGALSAGGSNPAANATGWDAMDALSAELGESSRPPLDDLTAATSGAEDTTAASSIVQADSAFGNMDPQIAISTSQGSLPPNGGTVSLGSAFNQGVELSTGAQASGWDALDALAAPPLPAPSLVSNNATVEPVGDDFGDFASNAVQSSSANDVQGADAVEDDDFGDFESTPVTSERKMPETNGIAEGDDSGLPPSTIGTTDDDAVSIRSADEPLQNTNGTKTLDVPSIPQGQAMTTVRSDSAFYSARASSMQSDISSLDDFVDAVESQPIESNSTAVNPDDPFAAFQSLAPSQPELPPLSSFGSTESAPNNPPDSVGQSSMDVPGVASMESSLSKPSQGMQEIATSDFDDFGDFEGIGGTAGAPGIETTVPPNRRQVEVADEDDFGDFGAAEMQKDANLSVQVPAPQQGTGPDLFGDFSAPVPPRAVQTPETSEDLFGDFSSQQTNPVSSVAGGADEFDAFAGQAAVEQPVNDFGVFSATSNAPPVEDDFGNFAASGPADDNTNDFGDFGTFGGAQPEQGITNAPPTQDDFGDFAVSAPAVAESDDFGDFGDFEGAEAQESANEEKKPQMIHRVTDSKDTQSDGSFDGFGGFDAVPTHNAMSDDSGDDWDAFQGSSKPSKTKTNDPETENLLKIRQVILAGAAHVPESLFQNTSGGHVDFENCFEANIGTEVPVSLDRKKRMQRSLQVATMLSSERSKLASTYWTAAISTANDELSLGLSLLSEAKSLRKKERDVIMVPLEVYLHGLGEIVRIVRMIVATIGDLLMLDAASLFTVDTLASSWCSLAVLQDALGIERLWKSVSEESSRLGLRSKDSTKHRIPSIPELRSSSSVNTAMSEELCQFTLQPFVDGSDTTTHVEWGSRRFMACTANFLANKCTFFSYDD